MTSFKPLTIPDIETIIPMMRDFYAIDNYPIEAEWSKKLFLEFIADENFGKCWLIYSDNAVVGYVILTFIFSFEYKGRIAFIDELYLSESARGKGVGTEAIDFVKTEAGKLMLKLLYLEVEHHNATAQKLYLAAGFEFHKRKFMRFKLQ